jgi:hypothetical protein
MKFLSSSHGIDSGLSFFSFLQLEEAIENEGGVCVRILDNATHLVVNTKTITFVSLII